MEDTLGDLLKGFSTAHSRRAFFELVTIAEFLAALPDEPTLTAARQAMNAHCLVWLRQGLFDHAFTASQDWFVGLTLLTSFAAADPAFVSDDIQVVAAMADAGLIGRIELASLAGLAAASRLGALRIMLPRPGADGATIARSIERRLLRSRTDCMDLAAVLTLYQLRHNELRHLEPPATGFLEVLYVNAVRSKQTGIAAIAALLIRQTARLPGIGRHATDHVAKWINDHSHQLLPPPDGAAGLVEFLRNTSRGWQLAASLAALALLAGDIDAD